MKKMEEEKLERMKAEGRKVNNLSSLLNIFSINNGPMCQASRMASTAPFNPSAKNCFINPACNSKPQIPLACTSLGFIRACSGRRVQSLWHFKSQFLRQVVMVINSVSFSDIMNVFARQQNRFLKKNTKVYRSNSTENQVLVFLS